jgi:DNA-binding transcriptional LysR family regulator
MTTLDGASMPLGGTDLNLMVALRALLEEVNVTRAGAKIGKSQPAMSTALARLRRHYQDELLVRVGRDYELTPFARALVPSVQQTLQSDPAVSALTVPPTPHGTKIRINEFPPGVVSPLHRTQSVDYAIVLDGEVMLVLDDSETALRPGDVVVQRGTAHRWENRTERTARMAFILIDGAFTADLLATLGGDVLGGLLHDFGS